MTRKPPHLRGLIREADKPNRAASDSYCLSQHAFRRGLAVGWRRPALRKDNSRLPVSGTDAKWIWPHAGIEVTRARIMKHKRSSSSIRAPFGPPFETLEGRRLLSATSLAVLSARQRA